METLIIHWDGEQQSFDGTGPVVIGRDPDVDVTLDNPHVSRRHVELRPTPSGWIAVDLDSTQGTFVGDDRLDERNIGEGLILTIGRPGVGAPVRLEVLERSTEPTIPAPTDPPASDDPPQPSRPGGELREDQLGGATVVTGDTLNVECAGRNHQLQPGRTYLIGRDVDADIVSANPTVSRRHASLTHSNGGWVIEDLDSSGGMFVDGRKVDRLELRGPNAVMLGDADSGERVVLQAAGERPTTVGDRLERTGRRGVVVAGVAAVALIAVVIGAFALLRGGGGASDPDDLSRASVNLEAGSSGGSGTIVDAENGLILTNAHVVAPSAPGQGLQSRTAEADLSGNPDEVRISVSPGLDKAAEPRFVGEVIAADGYLDLAVVKITKTASGNLIQDGDLDGLVELELGDSELVRTGDDIRVIGYPAIADSAAPTLTKGVVSGTVQDERVGSNRAFISVDADINAGNSGGSGVDADGRLIGVPTLTAVDLSSDTLDQSNRLRPIDLAVPLIDAARAGEDYSSPYVTPLGDELLTEFRVVELPDTEGFHAGCTTREASPDELVGEDVMAVSFDYSGFVADEHQDVRIDVVAPGGDVIGSTSTASDYPFEFDADGCATVALALVEPIRSGRYVLEVFLGPNFRTTPEQNVSLRFR